MQYSYNGTLFTLQAAGPTLTAAAAASMLVAASPVAGQNRPSIPANTLKYGDHLRFKARGMVVRAGRRQVFTRAELFAVDGAGGQKLVATGEALLLRAEDAPVKA